jgi:hypothetical protein
MTQELWRAFLIVSKTEQLDIHRAGRRGPYDRDVECALRGARGSSPQGPCRLKVANLADIFAVPESAARAKQAAILVILSAIAKLSTDATKLSPFREA